MTPTPPPLTRAEVRRWSGFLTEDFRLRCLALIEALEAAERERDCYRAARLTWPPHVLEAVAKGDVAACAVDAKTRHDNWERLHSQMALLVDRMAFAAEMLRRPKNQHSNAEAAAVLCDAKLLEIQADAEKWLEAVLSEARAEGAQAACDECDRQMPERDAEVRRKALGEAAQLVLGGSFLHDQAPTAQFAREVAAMLRRHAGALAAKGGG